MGIPNHCPARRPGRTMPAFCLMIGVSLAVPSAGVYGQESTASWADLAQDIVVDRAGAVYVTGYSWADGSGFDYLTLKSGAGGTLRWSARYDGPAGQADFGQAVCLDRQGRPVVTGHSRGTETSLDAVTIMYDEEGQRLWTARYDGPGSRDDWSYAVSIDPQGQVIIGGYSFGKGTEHDFLAVKYGSSDGRRVWTARYNPELNRDDVMTAMAVDGEGQVYLTGIDRVASTAYDFVTVKFATNGERLWLGRIAGPGGVFDAAGDICVDGEGYVCVTGERCRSEAGGETDCFSAMYDPDGHEIWSADYDGPGGDIDSGLKIVSDDEDGVYVAGKTLSRTTGFDLFLIKYDRTGRQVWEKIIAGAGSGADIVSDMVWTPDHRLVLTGWTRSNGTGRDCLTLSLDAETGQVLWQSVYDGGASGEDAGKALALDSEGNVCVAGFSLDPETDYDYLIIKYAPDGAIVWTAAYDGQTGFRRK